MGAPAISEFLDYFERVRDRTRRVAACIPDDRIEWSARAGGMTPGDLVRHLAVTERWLWAETVMGRPSRYTSHGRELADGKDAVLALFNRLHLDAVAIFATLTPERLEERCETPGGAMLPVWKWLRAMIEHEAHHRGQLYFILGQLGVETPPLFGRTSEALRADALAGPHED